MTNPSTTTKEALEREFDHFSIVPFKAICGADRLGETTTQDPRRAKCPICWQYWNEWEASFYFNARVSALGVKRISGEQWLTERGFADSRTYSNTEIGKLLEEYARISAPIVAPEVDLSHLDQIQKALDDASEERYQSLREWERLAERWKSQGDMYGWNFHQGMAAGANYVDIYYHRVTREIKTIREAAPVATVAPVEQSEPAHDYAVTASIQCANCGGGIADSWAYCHRCGANRETITAPASPAALRDEARPYDQGFADMRERAIQIAESYCEDIPQHVDIESDKNTFAAGYLVAAGGIRQALTRIPFAATPPSTLAKADEVVREWVSSLNYGHLPPGKISDLISRIERHFAPLAADNDAE